MATTAGGTPYVESSDLVANYPAVSLALAEHIDDLPQKVIQVLSTTKTDTFSMASSTFADITGLSVTITPTSSSSQILIIVSMSAASSWYAGNLQARLMRDSTAIGVGAAAGNRTSASVIDAVGNDYTGQSQSITFMDSPAATSSTIYKVQIRGNTANTVVVNRQINDGDIAASGRTISTITVMEIAA